MFCAGISYGQYIEIDLSTGMNTSGGAIGYGADDDTWTVTGPGGVAYTPSVCTNAGGQWANGSCSRWITPSISGTTPANMGAGTYVYRTQFRAPILDCGTAKILLNLTYIGGDNTIAYIRLNGNTAATFTGNNYMPMQYSISTLLPVSWLVPGWNYVDIAINNGANTPTGLNVCGKLEITTYTQAVPLLSGPTTVCQGNPLTFNGSLAPGSGALSGYFWEIQECDAAGNLTPGGFISGNWFTGVPGTYTFPNNPAMACGKYYRVKLAAVNDCTPWAEKTQVIYYACPVIPGAAASSRICDKNGCISIGNPFGMVGYSYKWTYTQGGTTYTVGTTSRVTVCPTATTVYTLTTTNPYGCSATQTHTVNVTPNDPTYTLTDHPINPTLYSLSAEAVDLNAFSNPGFLFEWIVEELNGSGSPYYAHMGYDPITTTNCWWTYPSQKFAGFGVPTPPSGSYTQTGTCLPASGNFVYGRTYRITRATWNDYCPRKQYSEIVAPTYHRNANGTPQLAIYEDLNAPDLTNATQTPAASVTEADMADALQVFPNPSTGVFTVSLANTADGIVEVFDVLGKKVETVNLVAGTDTYSIDLSGYAKGIYVVNVTAAGVKQSRKIVLQ